MPAADPEVLDLFQGAFHGNEEARAREEAAPDEEGQGQALLTEQHRHRCEVRWCIRSGFEWFKNYINGVRDKRGPAAAQRLWDDVKQQHQAGNAGAWGEWR